MKKVFAKLTSKPIIILLIVALLVLTIVQLILSDQLTSESGKLSKILSEISVLERENRDLSVKIHDLGSISKLKEQAATLGFLEPAKFFFVKESFLVAENR